MAAIGIGFQPDLIGVMSQFSQFQDTLKKHLATATEKSAGAIGNAMIDDMNQYFQNSTGKLAGSVNVAMLTEYLAYIYVDEPYAWRRDRGFSGMTDSLGRFYPHDPGIYYAEFAISDEDNLQEIAGYYIDAVYGAWQECIGNLPSGTTAMIEEL